MGVPASSSTWAMRAAVVDLPLVPVTAITRGGVSWRRPIPLPQGAEEQADIVVDGDTLGHGGGNGAVGCGIEMRDAGGRDETGNTPSSAPAPIGSCTVSPSRLCRRRDQQPHRPSRTPSPRLPAARALLTGRTAAKAQDHHLLTCEIT
jgi:hypothetical protein